jgi:murein L,D-transpeptidase YafK
MLHRVTTYIDMKRIFIITIVLLIVVLGFLSIPQSAKPLDKSTYIDSIVVEKSNHKMLVYRNRELLKTYKISLGRNSIGDKLYEGDKKTPEGLYFINDKNPKSAFHKNIGISYPNKQDIKEAEKIGKNPGGQIKIHGIKNGFYWIGRFHRLFDWTAGCIAVTDSEIDELYDAIRIGIPIEIKP